MFIQRALWALPVALFLAGCGGGSTHLPATIGARLEGRIAYFQGEPFTDGSRQAVRNDIYVRDADGSDVKRLTPATFSSVNIEPALAPDGTRVAFVSDNSDIYTVNVDGTDLRRVTTDDDFKNSVSWMPDGNSLIYGASEPDAESQSLIYRIGVDGTNRQLLLDREQARYSPALSPDGRTLAYRADDLTTSSPTDFQIYVAPLDGSSAPRLLTRGDLVTNSYAFSPDGRRLAFTVYSGFSVRQPSTLLVIDLDGTNQRALPTGTDSIDGVTWSPDGRYLAYSGDIIRRPFAPIAGEIDGKIKIIRADGSSGPRLLGIDGAQGGQFSPSWSR